MLHSCVRQRRLCTATLCSGDVFHLLHIIPEPAMVHIWAGVYVPPDENAELLEVGSRPLATAFGLGK